MSRLYRSSLRFLVNLAAIGARTDMIKAGETAPDFALDASDGRTYRLSEVLSGHRALLIFYPMNDTPG